MSAVGCLLVVAALLGLTAASAEACSVCYGDPNSAEVQAMKVGILVLLGTVGSVLAGFGGLFLYWMTRSRRLALMDEKGATHA